MRSLTRSLATSLSSSIPLALALAACGGGGGDDDDDIVDAAPQPDTDTTPDGAVGMGCAELDAPVTTLSSYPAVYDGDFSGAGADLSVAEGVCDDERSWFDQVGEEDVVLLTGLTEGTTYTVDIASPVDTSFYVVTDCDDAAAGPVAGQCLLFVDQGIGLENGEFDAPAGGEAFVVVDRYNTDPADDTSYQLQVYETECLDSAECSDPTPVCDRGLCVECVSAFDCDTGTCDPTQNSCVAGFSMCTGDDGNEDGDDGPAGATSVAPTLGNDVVTDGAICSLPAAEADYYTFTVAEGESRVFVLDWTGTEDLDLVLYDAEGNGLEAAFFGQPEVLNTGALAAGDYYVAVSQFDPPDTAVAVSYSLTARVPECATVFDCEDPGAPVCGGDGLCTTGPGGCTNDDPGEGGNDGPAGATDATPAVDGMTTNDAAICAPGGPEADYFAVDVNDGDNLTITLSWADAQSDLDLLTFFEDGTQTGLTFWTSPEVVTLTNLPAGTHYLQVTLFTQQAVTAAVDYTITVERTNDGGCAVDADCAAEYETQLLRGSCNGNNACVPIAGAGALADGDPCDSSDDCTSGFCSYVLFESDAEKSVCVSTCSDDTDCDAGFSCTTPFQTNFCHPDCAADTECGANTGSDMLDPDLPWNYLTCNAGTCDL